MKSGKRYIVCALVFLLALSTVSVSGAAAKTVKSGRSSKAGITLTAMSRTSIKAKWTKQEKYTNYEVYRKAAGSKTYKKIASVKTAAFTDRVKENTLYKYKVRPFRYIKGKKSYGKYSAANAATAGTGIENYALELSLPENFVGVGVNASTSDCSSNQKTAVVYRSAAKDGAYKKVKELVFKPGGQFWTTTYQERFVDKKVGSDAVYYYKIKIQKRINGRTYTSRLSAAKAVRTMPNWSLKRLSYSNLTDEKTRQEVTSILGKAGIRTGYIEEVMALAKDYHDVVGSQPYFNDGFVTIDGRGVDYEETDTYHLWMEKRSYSDVNCRLTAMTLFRDFLATGKVLRGDEFLSGDTDAMENYSLCRIQGADRDKFYTLYNPVAVEDTTGPDDILRAVQQEWTNRGIQFKEGTVCLVSVLCHDETDHIAFVGHTGVMVQDGGDVYFVEKFGPTSPFQVAKFQGKAQVREYLLNRFWKFYTPGVSAPPVIMENDEEL